MDNTVEPNMPSLSSPSSVDDNDDDEEEEEKTKESNNETMKEEIDDEQEEGVMEISFDEQSIDDLLRQRQQLMAQLRLNDEDDSGDESDDDSSEPVLSPPVKRCRRNTNDKVQLSSESSDEGEKDFVSVADDSEIVDGELNDSDLDIDRLLEEPYQNGLPSNLANKDQPPMCNFRHKRVLKHRSTEYFEVLPDGWIEITHRSGLPVYLHKFSRVCTFSRPYFIGPGSVRNHEVPIAAIPCYHQQTIRQMQNEQSEKTDANTDRSDQLERLGAPGAKVQTGDEFRERNLTSDALYDYAAKRFEFDTVKVLRFHRWENARTYHKQKRTLLEATKEKDNLNLGRPTLPGHIKLITVPSLDTRSKPQHKQFFLNPQGKTSIAVLHEYVQKVLKGFVRYDFSETRNASQPYSATVSLQSPADRAKHRSEIKDIIERLKARQHNNNGIVNGSSSPGKDKIGTETKNGNESWIAIGTGFGNSKKAAKLDAAKRALEVLVPGIDFDEDYLAGTDAPQDGVIALFDLIPLADSRIPELSAKAGQPSPFVVLHECLKRNSAFGDTAMETSTQRLKHQQHQFTMTVGKHKAQVVCSNKKEGKQKAAQAMLQKLHPQITTWGSLIRLYGYGAQRKLQESRKKKDSIIRLQGGTKSSPSNEPNQAILDKLKKEMHSLFDAHSNGINQNAQTFESTNLLLGSSVKNIDI